MPIFEVKLIIYSFFLVLLVPMLDNSAKFLVSKGGQGDVCGAILAHVPLESSPKASLGVEKDGEVLHSALD